MGGTERRHATFWKPLRFTPPRRASIVEKDRPPLKTSQADAERPVPRNRGSLYEVFPNEAAVGLQDRCGDLPTKTLHDPVEVCRSL